MVADAAGRVLAVAAGEVTPQAPLQHPAMVAIEKVAEEARKRLGGDGRRWVEVVVFSLVDNHNGPSRILFLTSRGGRIVTFLHPFAQ